MQRYGGISASVDRGAKLANDRFGAGMTLLRFSTGRALVLTILLVAVLAAWRVWTQKFSFDTTAALTVLRGFSTSGEPLLHLEGFGETNYFNIHFNLLYPFISPLHALGPTVLIFGWKAGNYALFLVAVRHLLRGADGRQVAEHERALFLLMVAAHPTFISNLISPNIWESDFILPIVMWSAVLFQRKRYGWGLALFGLTYLIKEDMMLTGIFVGLSLALISRRPIFLIFSALSAIWFIVVTHWLMPAFSASNEPLLLLSHSFGKLGDSIGEVVVNAVLNPGMVVENGLWGRKLGSIALMLVSLGALPVLARRSWPILVACLGVIGYTILSVQPYLDFSKHYVLAIFPFAVWAAWTAYQRVKPRWRVGLTLTAIAASLVIVVGLQVMARAWWYYFVPTSNSAETALALNVIPPGARVLTGGVGSPWTCATNDCRFSDDFAPADITDYRLDYILINRETIFWEVMECADTSLWSNLRRLSEDPAFTVAYQAKGVVLLARSKLGTAASSGWLKQFAPYRDVSHSCVKPALSQILRKR